MGRPAARSPDAHRPSNRRAASSRLFSLEFLLPLPFPSPSQLGLAIGWVVRRGPPSPAISWSFTPPDSRGRLSPHELFMLFPKCFDLYIHARRKIELHQRINRLRGWIENVQQTLMGADLELLTRFLVHVRRTQHAVLVLHRGQRNWTCDLRACALRGGHNFRRRLIEHAIIVCLQPDANFFVSYHVSFPDPFRLYPEGKNWRHDTSRILFYLERRASPPGWTGETPVPPYFFYCTISEIVPAPTVCPPSRMAKRKPFSIATGVSSSITHCTLSPGITLSVAEGSSATPVTPVVRRENCGR